MIIAICGLCLIFALWLVSSLNLGKRTSVSTKAYDKGVVKAEEEELKALMDSFVDEFKN